MGALPGWTTGVGNVLPLHPSACFCLSNPVPSPTSPRSSQGHRPQRLRAALLWGGASLQPLTDEMSLSLTPLPRPRGTQTPAPLRSGHSAPGLRFLVGRGRRPGVAERPAVEEREGAEPAPWKVGRRGCPPGAASAPQAPGLLRGWRMAPGLWGGDPLRGNQEIFSKEKSDPL